MSCSPLMSWGREKQFTHSEPGQQDAPPPCSQHVIWYLGNYSLQFLPSASFKLWPLWKLFLPLNSTVVILCFEHKLLSSTGPLLGATAIKTLQKSMSYKTHQSWHKLICIACLQKGLQQARENLYPKDVYDVRSCLKILTPLKAYTHLLVWGTCGGFSPAPQPYCMLGEILYLQQSTVIWLAESLLQQLVFTHSLSAETVF